MAIIIEVNEQPSANDVIVFKNGKWRAISRSEFLYESNCAIHALQERAKNAEDAIDEINSKLATMKEGLNEFAGEINQTLKEHHDVLQVLVGGDK